MSSAPYLCYRELLPPTSIRCSIFMRLCTDLFNSIYSDFLVIATSAGLSVFQVIGKSLKKVLKFEVFGKPQSLEVVSLFNENISKYEDHLLITFDIAKVVLARFDCFAESFHVLHVFNAEENAVGCGSDVAARCVLFEQTSIANTCPKIVADPSGRLACAALYGRSCFFIPFKASPTELSLPDSLVTLKPFIVDLALLGVNGVIFDICFIAGYVQPTLAVLTETASLPVGHCAKIRNTCCIFVFAVDTPSRSCSLLWKRDGLPHDSLKIYPIDNECLSSSILLISMNAILLVSRSDVKASATNGLAGISVDTSKIDLQPSKCEVGLELDSSHWTQVATGSFIGALKDGTIVKYDLVAGEGNSQATFEIIGRSVRPSCICSNKSSNVLFVGSSDSDSVLLGITRCSDSVNGMDREANPPSAKRRRSGGLMEIDSASEETMFYGSSLQQLLATRSSVKAASLELQLYDTVSVMGPILHGMFCGYEDCIGTATQLTWSKEKQSSAPTVTSAPAASSYIAPRELKESLHLCCGIGENSGISRISLGLTTAKIAVRDFAGATSIKSVVYSQLLGDLSYDVSYLFVSSEKTRILKYELPLDTGSKLMISEMPAESSFVVAEKTIAVGLVGANLLAQVCGKGIRILQLPEEKHIQDCFVGAKLTAGGLGGAATEKIVSADILLGWITLVTSSKTLYVLKFDNAKNSLQLYAKAEPSSNFTGYSTHSGVVGKDDMEVSGNGPLIPKDKKGFFVLSSFLDGGVSCSSLFSEPFQFVGIQDNLHSQNSKEHETNYFYHDINSRQDVVDDNTITKEIVSKMHLVVCDSQSTLMILDLESMEISFTSDSLALHEAFLTPYSKSTMLPGRIIKHVRDIRVHRMQQLEQGLKISRLCLVAIYESGDLGLYSAAEVSLGSVSSFSKVLYSSSFRKRKAKLKLRRSMPFESSNDAVDFEDANMFSIARIDSLNGHNGLIISGPRPVFISSLAGCPFTVPLSFPELPYANIGTYSVCPFVVRSIAGISVLWREFEELGLARNLRTATLGLYREIPNTYLNSGGIVSTKKMSVNRTLHKCLEILSESDDKIEKVLLKTKTFVMSFSEAVQKPFIASVLNPEELAEDNELYSRFFPGITASFAQPNEKIGPSPCLWDRKYSLALVQNSEVVDYYDAFKESEYVLDTEILYLSPDIENPVSKRVFLAVCTSITEKHGEDSQSNGRLLLFSLTYALFNNEGMAQQPDSVEEPESTETELDVEKEAVPMVAKVVEPAGGASAAAAAKHTKSKSDTKEPLFLSAQEKFLGSIKPKLKLEWIGPGPASVVKQLGNYVLSTVGPTLFVYQLKPNAAGDMELEPISFYAAQFFIASVSVTKNYIIISDALHGTAFLIWRDEDKSLILLARDADFFSACTSGLIRDDQWLGLVIADEEGNLEQLQYNPRKALSRLLCTTDFHVGSRVSLLLPHRLLSLPPVADTAKPAIVFNKKSGKSITPFPFGSRLEKVTSERSCLIAGNLDGGLAVLVPVEERVYHRLALLQQILSTTLYSPFGLNPREFRVFKRSTYRVVRKKGVLDGNLLWKFATLDATTQLEIVQAMGTTIDRILDSLQEIEVASSFF